ncbi:uncharacterized protein LOC108677329 [Hyalella azteca]|uniref:Uncharacterized protein LOC108677329 n=1 Tax=Hyalella azteca TaxID=294128 RepID=A0A8B7P7C5_HYAAZ|nr:uncharacterized protein LOC108677329 [Hyalella azteca]
MEVMKHQDGGDETSGCRAEVGAFRDITSPHDNLTRTKDRGRALAPPQMRLASRVKQRQDKAETSHFHNTNMQAGLVATAEGFRKKRKTDKLYNTALENTNVVKEKKLRSLATKGVVQVLNTLEQCQQEKKRASNTYDKKPTSQVSEMSAITSGNSGLMNFLLKKTMGGERKLFGEVKDEDDDQR